MREKCTEMVKLTQIRLLETQESPKNTRDGTKKINYISNRIRLASAASPEILEGSRLTLKYRMRVRVCQADGLTKSQRRSVNAKNRAGKIVGMRIR